MSSAVPSLKFRRVAVAGGTGFIGRALIEALVSGGASVTLLTRSDAAPRTSALPAIRIAGANCEELRTRLSRDGFDAIFNLAAYGVDPRARNVAESVEVNVTQASALAIAAARAGVKAFIHVGSNSEYAPTTGAQAVTEDHPLEVHKLYGATKAAGSVVLQAISGATGLPLVIARLFNVYGPGESPWRLLPSLYQGLRMGRRAALSPGTQVRDYLHVNDVAQGLIALGSTARPGGEVINLCSGVGVTVRSFAETLAEVMQADRALLGFGDLPFRADDVAYLVGNAERLHRQTSWRPRHTLQSGIADCVRMLEIV